MYTTSSIHILVYCSVSLYIPHQTVYGAVLAIIRSEIGCMVFAEKAALRSLCSVCMRLLQFGTNIGLEHKKYTTNFLVCGILNEIKKNGESM